jgi:hypothetical protein
VAVVVAVVAVAAPVTVPLAAVAARPLPAQTATTNTAAVKKVARTISPFYGYQYHVPYASQLPRDIAPHASHRAT